MNKLPRDKTEKEFIIEELVALYVDNSNLFKDVSASFFDRKIKGITDVDIVEQRQMVINKKLISLINLLIKKECRLPYTPYIKKIKADEIMEELKRV